MCYKNNIGDISFDSNETSDRYSKPIRVVIYGVTILLFPLVFIWYGIKSIGEQKRIGDKNIHL